MKLPIAKQITMMIAQMGISPKSPGMPHLLSDHLAKNPNVGFSRTTPGIGSPPERRYDNPLNIVCDANVAMIAGIPMLATIKPLRMPIAVAIASEISTANHIFQPIFIIR